MPTEFAPGLFAGQDLAARVEHAERTLIEEGAGAAARRDPKQRVLVRPIGGGLAVWAGPGSPLDKVVGVGMNGAAFDDAELDAVEQAFAEREAPVQIEVSTLADPAVVERLTRRGYVLFGFENVLGLRLEPGRLARPVAGIEIRDVGHDEFETWVNIVVDGFAVVTTLPGSKSQQNVQKLGFQLLYPRAILVR